MDIYVDTICGSLNIDYDKENRGYSVPLIVLALLSAKTAKESAYLLKCPDRTLSRILVEEFPTLRSSEKWRTKLLSTIGKNICFKCDSVLDIPYMVSRNANLCKKCDAARQGVYRESNTQECLERSREHYQNNKSDYLARNAYRRALKIKATPSWADLDKIKLVYRECPVGHHVDHIIPLHGELVCGLHVENNLQYLTIKENLTKSNKYSAD